MRVIGWLEVWWRALAFPKLATHEARAPPRTRRASRRPNSWNVTAMEV